MFVKPDTVVRWHRAGFRLYWNWLSCRGRGGRPTAAAEVRALVRRLATENPTWGAPRVHGELRMLGFEVPNERCRDSCHVVLDHVGVFNERHLGGLHHRYEWCAAASLPARLGQPSCCAGPSARAAVR